MSFKSCCRVSRMLFNATLSVAWPSAATMNGGGPGACGGEMEFGASGGEMAFGASGGETEFGANGGGELTLDMLSCTKRTRSSDFSA